MNQAPKFRFGDKTKKAFTVLLIVGAVFFLIFIYVGITIGFAQTFTLIRMGSITHRYDQPIVFYGKVIDENGNPIEGVQLDFYYRSSSLMPPAFIKSSGFSRKSDKNGSFTISGIKGRQLSLGKIDKAGYWTGEEKKNHVFNYRKGELQTHKPDSANPYVFTLIKEVKDNYLLRSDHLKGMKLSLNKPSVLYYDIIHRWRQVKEMDFYDFTCEGIYQDDKIEIKIKGMKPSDSFFVSEKKLLSVDDLHAFKPEIELIIEKDAHKNSERDYKIYIYMKTRDLNIYSRATLSFFVTDDFSYCNMTFATNPYGETNFATFDINNMDMDARYDIINDYRKSIQSGVLPKREDIKNYLSVGGKVAN